MEEHDKLHDSSFNRTIDYSMDLLYKVRQQIGSLYWV